MALISLFGLTAGTLRSYLKIAGLISSMIVRILGSPLGSFPAFKQHTAYFSNTCSLIWFVLKPNQASPCSVKKCPPKIINFEREYNKFSFTECKQNQILLSSRVEKYAGVSGVTVVSYLSFC